jgi:phage/plasmid-associated DNA primase
MAINPDPFAALEFVKSLFAGTTEMVILTSLPNTRDDTAQSPPRNLPTRDGDAIIPFVRRWDRVGRGMFFCVSTQAGSRSKKNARELPALWADIDFKNVDATPEQVIAAIATLRYPPTFIVSSGHGLHLYWRLAEWVDAQVHQEAVEHALHLLADHVAGDPAVCEVARLMRLPGTHNTKEEPIAVTAVQTKGAPVYAFGELLAWLEGQPAPILTRKPSAASAPAQTAQTVQTVQTVQTDPFRAAAMQSGFKPPIDVETRLGEMTYQGTGETGIHLTQIATSAALLHQGESIDDIVETLLEATRRAAGPAGAKWHWGREEKALRNMCRTWLEKHPELEPDEPERIDRAPSPLWASMEKTDPETGEVLDAKPLDTPKAEQAEQAKPAEPAKPKRAKKIKPHVAIAEAYLAAGEPMIAIEGGVWCYHDRLWRFETGDGWLNAELDHVAQELGLVSTSRLISEARNYLLRHKKVWRRQAPDFDHHGQIPTRSGLVDPLTGMLIPPAPEHYVTWRIEADYDPVAPCPLWRQLLADAFLDHPDAAACVQLIQELLGAGLIDRKGTERSRALVLVGDSNCGKSSILEVLAGLFGPDHNTSTFDKIEGTHGLVPFAKRQPWLLPEAFDASKWHLSSTVKLILRGEPFQINIKGGPIMTVRATAPAFWGSNVAPQFKEATKAVINRLAIVECRRVFDPAVPTGVAAIARARGYDEPQHLVLATEMPGLLAWAVEGLRRLLKRGHLVMPTTSEEAGHRIRRDSNLVAGFLGECVDFDPNTMVSSADFCAAFAVAWIEAKGEDRRLPSNDAITKAIRAFGDARIATGEELRDERRRYYAGVGLNAEGLRLHGKALEQDLFASKTLSTTPPGETVNRVIPERWDTKQMVQDMRKAHDLTRKMSRGGNGNGHDAAEPETTPETRDRSGVRIGEVLDPTDD